MMDKSAMSAHTNLMSLPHHTEASWRHRAAVNPREAQEIWIAKYDEAMRAYANNDSTSPCSRAIVFTATLYGLGYRNSELIAELRWAEAQRLRNGHRLD